MNFCVSRLIFKYAFVFCLLTCWSVRPVVGQEGSPQVQRISFSEGFGTLDVGATYAWHTDNSDSPVPGFLAGYTFYSSVRDSEWLYFNGALRYMQFGNQWTGLYEGQRVDIKDRNWVIGSSYGLTIMPLRFLHVHANGLIAWGGGGNRIVDVDPSVEFEIDGSFEAAYTLGATCWVAERLGVRAEYYAGLSRTNFNDRRNRALSVMLQYLIDN